MLRIGSDTFKERLLRGDKFSEDIFVRGDLDLSGCKSLKSLPKNLSVGGDLYLSGCENSIICLLTI